MAWRLASCCMVLLLSLTCVSAFRVLHSITDLKTIDFGHSVPRHSLLLLYWFAHQVNMNHNNVIRLTFNPNTNYGSHHYGNYEGLLDTLPQGYKYYTVGNLEGDSAQQLPDYVLNPQRGYKGNNLDRIVFGVHRWGRGTEQIIFRVFITQHHQYQGNDYDPNHTYEISPNLLREIRRFSSGNHQLEHLRDRYGSNANYYQLLSIRNTWGNLATLGLLLFIVAEKKKSHPVLQYHAVPEYNAVRNDHPAQNYHHVPQSESDICSILGYILLAVIIFVLIIAGISAPRR